MYNLKETNLVQATEELYRVFSRYPYNSDMPACPCCVGDEHKRALTSKPLRLLQGEDIERFAFKAVTTWGDVDDLKHFLPRILDLTAKGELMVDTFVVLGKLEYTKWQNWKEDEQDAVREFVIQWWARIANERAYYDRSEIVELYKIIGDIGLMLGKWKVEAKSNSIIVLIEFIYNEFSDLYSYKGDLYKLLGREGADKTTAWALQQKHALQEAFFYMEETEPDMAERASNALYILEH